MFYCSIILYQHSLCEFSSYCWPSKTPFSHLASLLLLLDLPLAENNFTGVRGSLYKWIERRPNPPSPKKKNSSISLWTLSFSLFPALSKEASSFIEWIFGWKRTSVMMVREKVLIKERESAPVWRSSVGYQHKARSVCIWACFQVLCKLKEVRQPDLKEKLFLPMTVQKWQYLASGASSHSARQREAKSSLETGRQSSSLLPHLTGTGAVSTHHGPTIPLWLDGADEEDAVGAHGARSQVGCWADARRAQHYDCAFVDKRSHGTRARVLEQRFENYQENHVATQVCWFLALPHSLAFSLPFLSFLSLSLLLRW